jgi:hypothetical protein
METPSILAQIRGHPAKLIPTAVPTAVQNKAWVDTDGPPMSWLHIKTSLMGAIWREVMEWFSSKG